MTMYKNLKLNVSLSLNRNKMYKCMNTCDVNIIYTSNWNDIDKNVKHVLHSFYFVLFIHEIYQIKKNGSTECHCFHCEMHLIHAKYNFLHIFCSSTCFEFQYLAMCKWVGLGDYWGLDFRRNIWTLNRMALEKHLRYWGDLMCVWRVGVHFQNS